MNIYQQNLLDQAPRALALLDQTRGSKTFGSFDRSFWYYRTLTDFPGATWQQCNLGLAALYSTDFSENSYFQNRDLREKIEAGLKFWAKIQHKSGSFDEWYANEQSFCPSAFTVMGAALIQKWVGLEAPQAAFESAQKYLRSNWNPTVMNQNLAAAAALQVLGDNEGARKKLEFARQHQSSSEGWFSEYGGMDLGYSTLAVDLLAVAYLHGAGDLAQEMALKLVKFLRPILEAFGELPGRVGSRGTSHGFAMGFEVFASQQEDAAACAAFVREGLKNGRIRSPSAVDDRYFAYFYYPQIALAAKFSRPEVSAVQSKELSETRLFPDSGLVLARLQSGDPLLISSLAGGAVAAKGPSYHLGYEIEVESGRRYGSCGWNERIEAKVAGESFQITGIEFFPIKDSLPLQRFGMIFPIFTWIVGKLGIGFATRIQNFIKHIFIQKKKAPLGLLSRKISWKDGVLSISDEIGLTSQGPIRALRVQDSVSVHSPSARQDRGALLSYANLEEELKKALHSLNASGKASLQFQILESNANRSVEENNCDNVRVTDVTVANGRTHCDLEGPAG